MWTSFPFHFLKLKSLSLDCWFNKTWHFPDTLENVSNLTFWHFIQEKIWKCGITQCHHDMVNNDCLNLIFQWGGGWVIPEVWCFFQSWDSHQLRAAVTLKALECVCRPWNAQHPRLLLVKGGSVFLILYQCFKIPTASVWSLPQQGSLRIQERRLCVRERGEEDIKGVLALNRPWVYLSLTHTHTRPLLPHPLSNHT